MDQCSNNMVLVHFALGILGAMNVALGTWLAHKRSRADKRERKRDSNGMGHSLKDVPRSIVEQENLPNQREVTKE